MPKNNTKQTLPEWNWTVGEVVAPFGIRGEVKVRMESDFPDRFTRLKTVCLRPKRGDAKLFTLVRSRLHKTQVLMTLEGIERIEDVDLWRGARVQIKKEDAVELPPGEFYVDDLIGMDVFLKDGQSLGKVDKVLAYPAQDLWQVGEALIPAVKEIVISVDATTRRIVIDPPPGMLPEESSDQTLDTSDQ